MSAGPAQFPGSERRPEARTLIDILLASVEAHPEAAVLDDGEVQLS